MAHMQRCLELTRINPGDVQPSATLSSPPARRTVKFPPLPIPPTRKCETTEPKSPGPGWIPEPGFNPKRGSMMWVRTYPKEGQRSGYEVFVSHSCKKRQPDSSRFAVNCADWDVYDLQSNNGTWKPILPGTGGDRWAKMACGLL